MLTLLKNIECYCPGYIGKKDILIAADKIYKIFQTEQIVDQSLIENTYFCDGLVAFPGLIDQHVHITGGGGESGFGSHVPELDIQEILKAGVTTIVGILGADGYTRSLKNLFAKAKSLELQGITTFIYSGSYALPAITFTNSILGDLVLIDKVIGAGEIAISDHRSSKPDLKDMLDLASETHLGGMLGGKAGVVHIHVGDGKAGLGLILQALQESDLPMDMFVPTHVNRSEVLFQQAVEYCRSGGNIDLTAGEVAGIPVPRAIKRLADGGIDLSKVTVSSDANGSVPEGGTTKIQALYEDFRNCILQSKMEPGLISGLFSENVARILKLYPKKGVLRVESDADILITDSNYEIRMLIGMGKLLYVNGQFPGT